MSNLFITRFPLRSILRKDIPRLARTTVTKCDDVITHTGQKWDCNDYRMVRYMNNQKLVNMSWAESLIACLPPKQVVERIVWCDGGSGAEGHPRIYINLDKPGIHSCGYCGLRYTKLESH